MKISDHLADGWIQLVETVLEAAEALKPFSSSDATKLSRLESFELSNSTLSFRSQSTGSPINGT